MKIIIITDGNSVQGLGHVYQSKTLAKYLLEKEKYEPEITFLTKSDNYVADLIRKDGFVVKQFADDEGIFTFLQTVLPQIVVFDKIDVAPLLAKKIKSELKLKLVIFTNLTEANQYADISVLADIGSNFENLREIKDNRISYWGPKYWLLRPEFYDNHLGDRVRGLAINNITLLFGGADPYDYTGLILEQLMKSTEQFDINVILGNAYRKEEKISEIRNLYKGSKSSVRVFRNTPHVAAIMSHSDLVFASPGLSLFEALKVGTPVLAFYQSDLQKEVYDGYIPVYGKGDVYSVIDLIHRRNFIFPDDKFISGMEIGNGRYELINQILN